MVERAEGGNAGGMDGGRDRGTEEQMDGGTE